METCRTSISRDHASGRAVALSLIVLICLSGCATLRSRAGASPLSPRESLNLGVSYERDGKLDLALREYERAAAGGTKSLAWTYQGNVHLARNDYSMAEHKYRAALKADPDNVPALNNLAWLLVQHGGSLVEAERLSRRALELNPEPRAPYEHTLQAILDAR
jgi:tetratricopeptide (TPR) repeat protein